MRLPKCNVCEKDLFSDEGCKGTEECRIGHEKIENLKGKIHKLKLEIDSLKESSLLVMQDIVEKQIPVDENIIKDWWNMMSLFPNTEKVPDCVFNYNSIRLHEAILVADTFDLFRENSKGRIYPNGESLLGKLKTIYNDCIKLSTTRKWKNTFNLTPEEIINENSNNNLQS